MEKGSPGDTKSLGGGVSEMRIPAGPGDRVDYAWPGETVVVPFDSEELSTRGSR